MPDARIAEFTQLFHKLYQEKYGIKYKWQGGKEQKLMQAALRYFETEEGGFESMKQCAEVYLSTEDDFVEATGHDLSHFLTNPHKWLKKLLDNRKAKNQEEARESQRKSSKEALNALYAQYIPKPMTDLEVCQDIAANPERFIRTFKSIGPVMKKSSPALHAKYCKLIAETVGRDRAREIWVNCNTNALLDNVL